MRIARSRKKAVVLVLTLWMVVVLTVIASSLAFDVQVNSKLALLQKQQAEAYSLAKSAVAAGMTHLQNDMLIDYQENPNQPYDAFSDVWAQPDVKEKDLDTEMGKGTFRFDISDEEGKINIRFASFKLLKAMVEFYGLEAPDSDDLAYAIIDWRDGDDMAQGQGAGSKENEYYSGLLGQKINSRTTADQLIYQAANEDFLTIEELLDVAGMTPELYYGYDPESQDAKEEKTRNDIALGKYIHAPKKKRKADELAIKDIITVRSSGKINLNTAPEEVLTILMYAGNNCTDIDSARTAAKSIVEFRGGGKKHKAPEPDDAFKSMQDVAKVPGINQGSLAQLSAGGALGQQIAFNSSVFSVKGIGRVKDVQKTITAIVQRDLNTYNPDDARLAGGKSAFQNRASEASRSRRLGSKHGKEADNYIRIPAIRVVQWIE